MNSTGAISSAGDFNKQASQVSSFSADNVSSGTGSMSGLKPPTYNKSKGVL